MPTPQEQLVDFLVGMPQTETFEFRSILLRDVVGRDGFKRDQGIQRMDLDLIVQQIRSNRTSLSAMVANVRPYLMGVQRVADLERLVEAVWTLPRIPALELGTPHRFDLTSLLDACLPKIRNGSGLIGFTVRCLCEALRDNLLERVKYERSVRGPTLTRNIELAGGLRSVPSAITKLHKLRSVAESHDLVCGVLLGDGAASEELWRGALAALDRCPNRVVLFMLMADDIPTPPGAHELPTPVFLRHHAESWWREVLEVQKWSTANIDELLAGFGPAAADDRLDMTDVYDGLADAIHMLKHFTDEDRFRAEWAGRKGAT